MDRAGRSQFGPHSLKSNVPMRSFAVFALVLFAFGAVWAQVCDVQCLEMDFKLFTKVSALWSARSR